MKYNIDEAIETLKEYVELDRHIREGDTESDYSKFCENKCLSIESLIEYVYASKRALKTYKIKEVIKTNSNNKQLTDEEIKQIIACLDNAIYEEDEFISYEQRCKLIEYSSNLPYKLYGLLGIEYDELIQTINIDSLEVEIED